MPPDTQALVRKFVPNNPKMARVLTRICNEQYRARYLPMKLVRMLANKGIEDARRNGVEFIETKIFEEKMEEYAKNLKPRFMSEIALLNQRGRRV